MPLLYLGRVPWLRAVLPSRADGSGSAVDGASTPLGPRHRPDTPTGCPVGGRGASASSSNRSLVAYKNITSGGMGAGAAVPCSQTVCSTSQMLLGHHPLPRPRPSCSPSHPPAASRARLPTRLPPPASLPPPTARQPCCGHTHLNHAHCRLCTAAAVGPSPPPFQLFP